jgi:hypothetical protein
MANLSKIMEKTRKPLLDWNPERLTKWVEASGFSVKYFKKPVTIEGLVIGSSCGSSPGFRDLDDNSRKKIYDYLDANECDGALLVDRFKCEDHKSKDLTDFTIQPYALEAKVI